ncbi:MAG: hypothetical protein WC055_14695 [Melioribacteraceae bacterium]
MRYLVLYNKKYIKPRIEHILKDYVDFTFEFQENITDFNGELFKLAKDYDGICVVKDGEWISGKWGNHLKFQGKSIIRVESKEKYFRKWKRKGLVWELVGNSKNGDYKQLEYTFEHELGHSLCYLQNRIDTLHLWVSLKKYDTWFLSMNFQKKNRLLSLAKSYIGKDASPNDIAPDELGCADSASTLLGQVMTFPNIISTAELFRYLDKDIRFKRVLDLTEGNIIISPTGYGNGKVVGHVGIIGKDCIYSNNSKTGLWDKHLNIEKWVAQYRTKGGLPIYVFKLL